MPLYYTEVAGPCGSNLSDSDETYELPLKYFQSVSDDVMQYGFVLEYILTQSQARSESKEDCIQEQQGIIARHQYNKTNQTAREFLSHGFNVIEFLKKPLCRSFSWAMAKNAPRISPRILKNWNHLRQQCDERQNLTDKEIIVLSKKCDGQTSIKGRYRKNYMYTACVKPLSKCSKILFW